MSAQTGRKWLAATEIALPSGGARALGQKVRGESLAAMTLRELARNRGAMIGVFILMAIILLAIFAPIIAPFDPIALAPAESSQPPSAGHLMGTDVLGRDVFSRVIYGARISLWLGLVSVGIACSVGLTLGLVAGYFGGWVETVVMRGADMMLAFPSFLLALTILFALGQSIVNVMIAVGLASVPGYTRIVRGSVLSTRELEYVVAAVIVIASVGIAWAIITSASLSFLGMGVQPPTPEWGSMVNDGMRHLRRAWWISSFPALAIVVTVLAINLVGDGLRDALDPRLRNVQ
jgi:peptide/nickel transport system permease protein